MRHIYLTVDTECHDLQKANLYIYGKRRNEFWGIRKILELAKEEKIPVNFFVDVGECKKYGELFVKELVETIHSYKQPVYFHLHPEYISGDYDRTFLWEYSYDEKEKIILEAIEIYKKYSDISDKLIFRAGRYGVDHEVYDILSKLGKQTLDLSYVYNSSKMCHFYESEICVQNVSTEYKNIIIFPNTRFIAFDYFGRKKCVGLDSADATMNEFKRFIKETNLNNVVWTMHSWNFIIKWFFSSTYFRGDKAMVKKFRRSVACARQQGFIFSDLADFLYVQENDEIVNLCDNFSGKLMGIINNFNRFRKIGRLNKKYFIIYTFFYVAFFSMIVFCLKIVL